MTFPVGIHTVTLTGRYIHPDGSAFAGSLDITMPNIVTIGGADTIAGGTIRVTLDVQGAFSVVLIATDNAATLPLTWTYRILERLEGSPIRAYSIALPQATPVVDISDVARLFP